MPGLYLGRLLLLTLGAPERLARGGHLVGYALWQLSGTRRRVTPESHRSCSTLTLLRPSCAGSARSDDEKSVASSAAPARCPGSEPDPPLLGSGDTLCPVQRYRCSPLQLSRLAPSKSSHDMRCAGQVDPRTLPPHGLRSPTTPRWKVCPSDEHARTGYSARD